ncbi:response regulator transcription factor [Niameybacter massiliensis]|uniref:Stage 0 sporulation protein A homolog n=1 Tax=Holtiella tumoricola TaxID=3018743 RepID=A0AA42J0B8_9FIRM|nr:response regulator transcription factor [Holtiella tumoricola]MDA3730878.1 response regulator transcription factor [Holtiella tumoricola]
MNKNNTILVADDDQEIREILNILLTGEGFDVIVACDGIEVVEKADENINLIILDVSMPRKSGFIAASEIRKKTFAPILFLTAHSQESDKTMGFSAGGDDYITKPFSNSELLLRVKALLRRYNVYQPQVERNHSHIQIEELEVNLDTESILISGQPVILTHTEYKILELLITHRKKIFSIDNIFASVWGEDAVGDNAVMVHIKNLRKKIEKDNRNPRYIKTAWGKGYYID